MPSTWISVLRDRTQTLGEDAQTIHSGDTAVRCVYRNTPAAGTNRKRKTRGYTMQQMTVEEFKHIQNSHSGHAFRGKKFEEELMLVQGEYWRLRIAFYQKFEVPVVNIPDPKGRKVVYRKRTGFDFVGSHFYGDKKQYARSLYFEAKSHQTMLGLPILEPNTADRFGLKFHQLESLAVLEERQCECYILFKNPEGVFRASALELKK